MELEQDHYDVVVIGTGLAESIAAASLANSGKSVLHLDPNEYYGSSQASLTLDELHHWLSDRSKVPASASSSSTVGGGQASYASPPSSPSASPYAVPPALVAQQRQYALSLYPALLPSRGSLIQTLIDSGVSKYVGFRLLDGVSVWQDDAEDAQSAGQVGGADMGQGEAAGGDDSRGKGKGKGRATRVPGSKEDVFKDKSVSLVDKRRLMRFLMFVAGDYEEDALYRGKEEVPIIDLLTTTFSLPRTLATRIAYAIAHCSSISEPSAPTLERTRRYLKSIGRYGPSAFLVGQYGGAGEIAQGFCRACAVKGGTYVLGPQAILSDIQLLSSTSDGQPSTAAPTADKMSVFDAETPKWRLSLPCHPRPITASHIITTPDHLWPELLGPADSTAETSQRMRRTVHGIAILPDMPACLRRAESGEGQEVGMGGGDDTGVVLFPPPLEFEGEIEAGGGGVGLVRALIMGEGTGSCPAGQYIVYLSAELPSTTSPDSSAASKSHLRHTDAKTILQPYLDRIHPSPSYTAYYTLDIPLDTATPPPTISLGKKNGLHVIRPFEGSGEMTQGLDRLAEEGRRVWEEVMGRNADGSAEDGAKGEGREGGEGGGEGREGWWAGMGEQGDEEDM